MTANVKGWMAVVMAIMGLVAAGTVDFPDTIPATIQHAIVQWDSFLLALMLAANGVLHFMPDAPPSKGDVK